MFSQESSQAIFEMGNVELTECAMLSHVFDKKTISKQKTHHVVVRKTKDSITSTTKISVPRRKKKPLVVMHKQVRHDCGVTFIKIVKKAAKLDRSFNAKVS